MLKRAFYIDLEHCPNCGGQFNIITAILESAVSKRIPPCTWDCRLNADLGLHLHAVLRLRRGVGLQERRAAPGADARRL